MSFNVATTIYDPKQRSTGGGEKREFELLPEGKHMATIHELVKKREDMVVNSRDDKTVKHVADLLEATYVIHEENPQGFSGRRIWSSAIWVWKDAEHIKAIGKDDEAVPNNGGNERYAKFLEIGGYDLDKQTIEVEDSEGNKQKRDVYSLPVDIDFDLCKGKFCLIDVKNRKYTDKNGVEKTAQNELGLYKWEGPKDDDLPF
tara:strand:+ start:87 stop:692 length:606 start_codon:yes stop_codon:yes gene_type:complete